MDEVFWFIVSLLLAAVAVMAIFIAMIVMVCFWTILYVLRALGWVFAHIRK